MTRITTHQRKALIDKIAQLTDTEHQEIYKIIKNTLQQNKIGCTHNRNGLFIDFKLIPNDIFMQIEAFVEFCNSNRSELDNYDKCINECKINKDISKIVTLHHTYQFEPEVTDVDNNLQSVIARESKQHEHQKQWLSILKESKQADKIALYIDSLENLYAKIHKKKMCNMKYANAKKKYARKVVLDKKFDSDLSSILVAEEENDTSSDD